MAPLHQITQLSKNTHEDEIQLSESKRSPGMKQMQKQNMKYKQQYRPGCVAVLAGERLHFSRKMHTKCTDSKEK